ncbi:MAG: hypothetical protein QXY08_02980 [Nitrososphaerales archaeon]
MDLKELREKYPNLWVAARVLKRDENGQPIDFEMLCVGPHRLAVREKTLNEQDICFLCAKDVIQEGWLLIL